MAGLALKSEALKNAGQQLRFNIFVQIFNFGFVSIVVYGVSRGLLDAGAMSKDLADGMVVCASLPITINMVLVLSMSSGGDEAVAIFNEVVGNMIGAILSPVLILAYAGVTTKINLRDVYYELAVRAILPVLVGQVVQKVSKSAVHCLEKHKTACMKSQQYALVFIVYTVFCTTFGSDKRSTAGSIFVMIALQFFLLCIFMTVAWILLKHIVPNQPRLRVTGIFACTHKSVRYKTDDETIPSRFASGTR